MKLVENVSCTYCKLKYKSCGCAEELTDVRLFCVAVAFYIRYITNTVIYSNFNKINLCGHPMPLLANDLLIYVSVIKWYCLIVMECKDEH